MKSSETNKFVSFFTYNWKRKLISIIIATGIWFWVNSQEYSEQTASLPIHFRNLPDSMMILEKSDETVTFTVRLRNKQAGEIDISQWVTPFVELSNATTGDEYYPIELDITNADSELNINLMKQEVKLHIDTTSTKDVEVKPRIIGTPVTGFMVDSIEYEPEYVTLKGPSGEMDDTEYIETETIDIGDTSESMELSVGLVVPEYFEIIGESSVLVTINYIEKTTSREVSVPLKYVSLSDEFNVIGTPLVSLVIEIPDRYSNTYNSRVAASVNCSTITEPGFYELPLSVTASGGIEVVDHPDTAEIEVVSVPAVTNDSTNQ